MPYTSHGHPYGWINVDEPRPKSRARCGGPRMCKKCAAEAAGWRDPIGKVRDVRNAQGADGTWNSSAYMRGLYNGLELALSILEGEREPRYKGEPDGGYLEDRPRPDVTGPEYEPAPVEG